jgi:hypothetical protein
MSKTDSSSLYDIYSASYTLNDMQVNSTKFDISVANFTDGFKSTASLGDICISLNGNSSTPTTPSGPFLEGYTYEGCKTDNVSARSLHESSTWSQSMTYSACALFCDQFLYFGVEYGTECYCGHSIANSSLPALEADCSMACAGDSKSVCGGPSRINVFKDDINDTRKQM